jgi:hypothetical protein
LGALTEEKQSHVLLYGANIGGNSSAISMPRAVAAMVPEWYPADSQALEIGLQNSAVTDKTPEFWQWEFSHLRAKIDQQLCPRLAQGAISHLSVFVLAPQPLLIALGSLLSDIHAAEVYQLHREPPGWKWQDGSNSNLPEFRLAEPSQIDGPPALVFSLSGSISEERIRRVIPEATLWKVSVDNPNSDFLKEKRQSSEFRTLMRICFDRIKSFHGQDGEISVFPAMPVALAVELGRVRMPKADLPMRIYDEDRAKGGFRYAIRIGD